MPIEYHIFASFNLEVFSLIPHGCFEETWSAKNSRKEQFGDGSAAVARTEKQILKILLWAILVAIEIPKQKHASLFREDFVCISETYEEKTVIERF